MKTVIFNAHVVSPGVDAPNSTITICDSKIVDVSTGPASPDAADVAIDANGSLVVPGFIDTHIHGAVGADVMDGKVESVTKIAQAKLSEGCTSFLPTTLTASQADLRDAARAVAEYRAKSEYARAVGLHLEGPYINLEYSGAQNPEYVRPPNIDEVLEINAIAPVKVVSFAPETPGGAEFTAQCIANKIIPCAGHTGATCSQFTCAYNAGLRRVTHFGNRMSKLHHREIGVVGAALMYKDVDLEVIGDRIHLCPEMLSLIFAVHPVEHVQLITDALKCSHLPDGYSFNMGGLDVRLENGEARLVGDGNLAGSTLHCNYALYNLQKVTGLPLKDIIRISSLNQAIALGIDNEYGRVAPGYVADLAVLNPETYAVEKVFLDGKQAI